MRKMTPRQNILFMYRRTGYEYAPAALYLCESQVKRVFKELGTENYTEAFDLPVRGARGLTLKAQPPEHFLRYYDSLKKGTRIDKYGVAHEPGSEAAYHMTYMRNPLRNANSVDDILNYAFPIHYADDTIDYAGEVKALHDRGYIAHGSMACTIWEQSWYIRGMDELMMDMLEESEMAVVLLDKITDMACKRITHYARIGVDTIEVGDDIGMQKTPMMSLNMYRQWLKPRLKKVITTAKEINPDVLVMYHSCGFIEPFIDDLIDAGVDILNPIQPECMDFEEIHAIYGNRISFNGTLGTQTVMPFGTPEQVRETVYKNLQIAGAKGGLFCCPTHIIEPEVPWENIMAYIEACRDYKPV